jgi:hypothetical protein
VTNASSSVIVSARLTSRCSPIVEVSTPYFGSTSAVCSSAAAEEQKLPKPWVGSTVVSSASSVASRRAVANCLRVSSSASDRARRSVRPTEPYSRLPPVNTASRPAWVTTYDRCVGVCPGVCMTRTRSSPTVNSSPSDTPWKAKNISSAAFST